VELECIDLERQIERCERLAQSLTDEDMRQALEDLAGEYREQLKRRRKSRPFMLGDSRQR
jgi:hypothetical protein